MPVLRGQFLLSPTLTLRLLLLEQQLAEGEAQPSKRAGKSAGNGGGPSSRPCVAFNTLQLMKERPFMGLAASAAGGGGTTTARSGGGSGGAQEESAAAGGASVPPSHSGSGSGAQDQLALALALGLRHLGGSRLTNASGHVAGLGGLCTHLFWTEPSNFILARQLSSGVFHRVLARHAPGSSAAQEEALLILAHLFCRMQMQPAWARSLKEAARGKGACVVILPDLPEVASAVIDAYQAEVGPILVIL